MKTVFRLALIVLMFGIRVVAQPQAHCQPADLSTAIPEFDSYHVSRIEALLNFGHMYSLCLGIGYIDKSLLTEPADLHVRNSTVQGTVMEILGSSPTIVQQVSGVVEITQHGAAVPNVFDLTIPRWQSQRLPLQLVNTLLHWAIVHQLNPEIGGFAGHDSGDPHDEVGPFDESNKTVRYLLDEIVAQSTGAAWITVVSPADASNLTLPKERRVWMIVEYGGSTQFPEVVSKIAGNLRDSNSLK